MINPAPELAKYWKRVRTARAECLDVENCISLKCFGERYHYILHVGVFSGGKGKRFDGVETL